MDCMISGRGLQVLPLEIGGKFFFCSEYARIAEYLFCKGADLMMEHRLEDILDFNKAFVEKNEYIPFQAKRISDHKVVVVSCMDTRLTELLPHAMNLKAGDAKFIKDAGAIVS